MLMPEIALTAQLLDRFAARFGVRPAEWHSQLSPRKRARTWAAVAAGEVQVVVGARSALFLPYADLGLIVVDEEHDPAYKQEDGAHYHARDMAVVRGRIAEIPVVLASATPSVETEVNARRGRYARLHLPERFGGQHLPSIEAIDLRREGPPRGRFIAPRLAEAVRDRVGARRAGAAVSQPPRLCAAHVMPRLRLPHAMPELRCLAGRSSFQAAAGVPPLRLRYAAAGRSARNARRPKASLPVGPGVERLEQEAAELFPGRAHPGAVERHGRVDGAAATGTGRRRRTVVSTSSSARNSWRRAINFPKLNLVGIVDADLGLGNGDPRAAERTFQLLHQVVGRAGRAEGFGKGFLQTHQPEHPVMRALISGDREAFYDTEIAAARAHALSAVRTAGEPAGDRERPARRRRLRPRARAVGAATTRMCACWGRPKRRSRWCGGATVFGCW